MALALTMLAALPLLGLGGLGWIHASQRSEAAADAESVRRTTLELVELVELRFALSAERIPSEAYALGPEVGLPIEVVNQVLGYDVVQRMRDERVDTDAQITRVNPRHWTADDASALAEVRRLLDEGGTDIEHIDSVFEETESSLTSRVASGLEDLDRHVADLGAAVEVAQALDGLRAANTLQSEAQRTLSVLANGIVPGRSSDVRVTLIAARSRLEQAVADVALHLPAAVVDRIAEIEAEPGPAAFVSAVDDVIASSAALPTMSLPVDQLSIIFQGGIERAGLLLEVVEAAADQMEWAAAEQRDAALDDYRSTMLMVLLIAGITAAGTVALARSFGRPLARLEMRARRVRNGDLSTLAGADSGPREMVVVAAAFDEAIDTLRRLEQQADALASGRLDDPVLQDAVPGRLGAALHESVHRLSRSMRERTALEQRLIHEATHDALTGLPNRASAMAELARLLDRDRPVAGGDEVAVLFIDLDGFKAVNDIHGHAVGDHFLQVVAHRMAAAADGRFVARLGGDEFLLLGEIGEDAAEAVGWGHQVLDALRQPVLVDGVMLPTDGACVGVAISRAGTEPSDLLKRADIALYEAKSSGGGAVVHFDDDLAARTAERDLVERQLPGALRRNELEVHYQPIVDAMSGRMTAAEALVRWRHPVRGLLAPTDFLDVAESGELIRTIDVAVLRQALADISMWDADGRFPDLTVSVNVSRRQLMSTTLFHDVELALREAGVAPSRLMLEISEHALLADLAETTERLTRLRTLGVQIALDDFGAGYTSIGHLRLPVDVVKVDQSIVQSLHNERELTLLTMFGEVASRLGLRMVAEGVETRASLMAVKKVGCDLLQGHLIAPVLTADELVTWGHDRGLVVVELAG